MSFWSEALLLLPFWSEALLLLLLILTLTLTLFGHPFELITDHKPSVWRRQTNFIRENPSLDFITCPCLSTPLRQHPIVMLMH